MSQVLSTPSRCQTALRVRLLTLLSFVLLVVTNLVTAASAHAAPAQRVYAGVYLHDVAKFDQKDGVFDVDLELWVKWLGDFDHEKLRIANAAEVDRSLRGEESDGEWHSARWRVRGTLRGEFPLQRFPFDRQTLSVILELAEQDGILVPDLAASGMRERFSITGWLYDPVFVPRVGRATYRSDLGSVSTEGRPTSVQRAAFEVTLRRPLLMAATKLFLPLMVILLVALIALLIHPKWLDVRSGVGVTALLACFAFQFSVADTMPSVAYMTVADVLFLAAYAITAVLLGVSIASAWLYDKGKEGTWRWLDIGTLVAAPLVLVVVVAVTAHEAPPPPHAPAKPLGGARPHSGRDVVRIGTDALPSALGGLHGRAANWGTVRTELDGTRVAALVEEVPSVTTNALTFLADGKLDVTWHLRKGLKWSDGAPLTVDDLLFTLQVSPDSRIVSTRVENGSDFIVRYADRVAIALEGLTPLPRHALEAEFKKGGYDAVREYRRGHALPSSGPYRFVGFEVDDHAILEANPNFPGPKPSIRRIEIRKYADDAALVRAFEDKQLDLIAPNAISPETAAELAKRLPEAVKIRPSEVQMFLHPDLAHPALASVEVRRGILSAIDRERLRLQIFGDAAKISDVPVPGPPPEGAVLAKYDPEAARKAFEDARVLGQKIPLFHGVTPVDKAVAAALAKDLAAAGLTLEPREVAKLSDLYRKRKHGGLLLTSTTGERDALPEKYWSLPQVGGKFDRKFRNPAYTDDIAALIEREERALYPERREQIRDLLFVEYSKRLPSLPLLFLADRIVAVPDLRGWEEGSGSNFGTTIERWYFVPPALQVRGDAK